MTNYPDGTLRDMLLRMGHVLPEWKERALNELLRRERKRTKERITRMAVSLYIHEQGGGRPDAKTLETLNAQAGKMIEEQMVDGLMGHSGTVVTDEILPKEDIQEREQRTGYKHYTSGKCARCSTEGAIRLLTLLCSKCEAENTGDQGLQLKATEIPPVNERERWGGGPIEPGQHSIVGEK